MNLKGFDHQQAQILEQVKEETEYLEQERQKLIDLFKKEKTQLELIEKKIQKLEQTSSTTTIGTVLKKSNSTENAIFSLEQTQTLNGNRFESTQNKSIISLNNSLNVNNHSSMKAVNKIQPEQFSNSSLISANPMIYKNMEWSHSLKKLENNVSSIDNQVQPTSFFCSFSVSIEKNNVFWPDEHSKYAMLFLLSNFFAKNKTRKRDLEMLNEEQKKRDDLVFHNETPANDMKHSENVIKLREKKPTQVFCKHFKLLRNSDKSLNWKFFKNLVF